MVVKIALTGGPCAGKSSALEFLAKKLPVMGLKVVVAPEAATIVINSGVQPGTLEFQRKVFQLQLKLEKQANEKASMMSSDVVALYDRSIFDQLAYITPSDFKSFLADAGMDEADVSKRYHGIIHLVSAAVGTDAYTVENNQARRETAEEAILMEEKTLRAFSHFQNLVVVDNSTGFQKKLKRTMAAVIDIVRSIQHV